MTPITDSTDYVLTGGRFVLPHEVAKGALVVRGGLVATLLAPDEKLPAGLPRHDVGGAYVTPGLVEVHLHGAGGIGFDALGKDAAEGVSSLARARDFLRDRGITTFVPTLVCREAELAALAAALDVGGFDSADLPGIYVEGPFIAASRKGGIPLDSIKAPDPRELARILALARGRIRLMTFAPELPGAEAICEALQAAGVVPCLGHSDASLDRMRLPEGKYSITHLFNAMSPFSHKKGEEGLSMLPFVRDVPFVELNADGVHVNSAALRAAARAIEPGRLVLISDATVAAGLPWGEYSYYGMRILSGEDGVRYADSGTLMGSNRLAPDVLRHWLRELGASIPTAVSALTRVPAKLLGIDDRRGAIAEGLEALLVVWEGEFESAKELLLPAGRA